MCFLVLWSSVFLTGTILAGKQPIAGSVMLTLGGGLFRIWMTCEWAMFIWEKRGFEGTAGGNTFRKAPKTHQMLGHIAIQAISTLTMVVACAVAGTNLKARNDGYSLTFSMLSVSHSSSQGIPH
jgi:hypothetical protein